VAAEPGLAAEDGSSATLTLKTVAVEIRIGSPSHTISSFPQLHVARRVVIDTFLLAQSIMRH
jgi:hypothetical protein